MDTETIIRKHLAFLEKEYDFTFNFNGSSGDHYLFKNTYGTFEYYEWPQFGEKEFYISYEGESKRIDMLLENPKMISLINHKKRGIKGFFYDEREDYWTVIEQIVRNEIKETGTIFGLRVEKNNNIKL